jgi:hypothetical protein
VVINSYAAKTGRVRRRRADDEETEDDYEDSGIYGQSPSLSSAHHSYNR